VERQAVTEYHPKVSLRAGNTWRLTWKLKKRDGTPLVIDGTVAYDWRMVDRNGDAVLHSYDITFTTVDSATGTVMGLITNDRTQPLVEGSYYDYLDVIVVNDRDTYCEGSIEVTRAVPE
jgi:hypothetical protein